jgi:hypothetical protein
MEPRGGGERSANEDSGILTAFLSTRGKGRRFLSGDARENNYFKSALSLCVLTTTFVFHLFFT